MLFQMAEAKLMGKNSKEYFRETLLSKLLQIIISPKKCLSIMARQISTIRFIKTNFLLELVFSIVFCS